MDQIARQLGIDPFTFREKNVLRRGEFVAKGTPLMDTDYFDLMRQATSAIQWDGRSSRHAERGADVVGPARWIRGRGLALGLRHGTQAGGKASAMASLDSEGILRVQHNAPEIGQGTHNLISIIASRVLGIPRGQIRVGQPDTSIDLPFAGVSAQRTTVQMGNAVENACANLKRELVALACRVKGGSAEDWLVAEGRLWRAENSLTFGEIVRTLGEGASVKAIGEHSPPPTEKGSAFRGMGHWAPSAAAAEVEVDRETGELRVLRFAVIADAGKALHYPSAKSQVEGGAVMGFGHALFEEVIYQEGRILNADPFQYRLPVMEEIPEAFFASMLENRDGPGPFGSKGMSQTSIVTVAPAIGNAIFDAVGARVRSLPITPEKILQAMGKIK
jgi:CO/xanthine dehydrogenase Mo-binding subunit